MDLGVPLMIGWSTHHDVYKSSYMIWMDHYDWNSKHRHDVSRCLLCLLYIYRLTNQRNLIGRLFHILIQVIVKTVVMINDHVVTSTMECIYKQEMFRNWYNLFDSTEIVI